MLIGLEIEKAHKAMNGYRKGQYLAEKSLYQPSLAERERIAEIKDLFTVMHQTHSKPYAEFNNKSLIQIQDECQKLFNNWNQGVNNTSDDAWKSDAVRPIVRNRAISIAAHLTGNVIEPRIIAQNPRQEEDKEGSLVMKDLMEWANQQADYDKTFLYAVLASLVNPATIVHTEYSKIFRTVKDIQDDGTWKEKTVIDPVFSGFTDTLVPLDEFFIYDMYEHDIQRQPCVVWRKVIDYSIAQKKYVDYPNFKYVKPGIQAVFDADTASFYEVYDQELFGRMVEEVIYYERNRDLQLTVVNGVLLCHPDHPITRADKMYPFVKGGYELIDEGKFFYYFSLVRKMKDDAAIINTLYRMIIDGTYLQLMPPTAVFGDEIVNSSVVAPGVVTNFKENTKLQKIDVGNNLTAGFNAIEKMEQSVQESSSDTAQSGQNQNLPDTLGQQVLLQQNARIMLGMFAKMIGFLVRDLGRLRIGDIIQFMTVGEMQDVAGAESEMKYRSFLIPDKAEDGKKVSHKVAFVPEGNYQPEDVMAMEGGADMAQLGGMDEETKKEYVNKGYKSDTRLYIAYPEAFRKLEYKVVVTADMVTPPSDALQKALAIEEYDRAVANPLANQEAIFSDLLLGVYDRTKYDVEKYITKPQPTQLPMQGGSDVVNKLFGAGKEGAMNKTAQTKLQ